MNKKDLIDLGIAEDVADKVVILHGKDIETHKTKINDLTANQSSLATQLEEANKQIEDFKGMKIDEIKAAADDYKAKFEQAQTESAAQLASLKFDHALESALTNAKAKNIKAVQALLSRDALKLNEDGSILGLKEQLEKIKSSNDYLFADTKEVRKIVTKTNNQTVHIDPFEAGLLKGAKLTQNNEEG